MVNKPRKVVFQAKDLDLQGHVLGRIASELEKFGHTLADSHIKNNCDLHGKGNHIKGSGPNYNKTSTPLSILDQISNPASTVYQEFIKIVAKSNLLERITKDVSKIKRG